MVAIDLFAGAGGFSTGAVMAGCSVAWAANHLKNGVTAFDIVSRLDAALDAPTTGE